MNRKRQDVSSVRISDEEYSRLQNKFETLRNEFGACRRKLDSKCEALLILSQELDQCRSERDQFKLMAEQLRERYQAVKKSLSGPTSPVSESGIYKNCRDTQSQSLARLLLESRENGKSLQFEVEDLRQKLHDAQGDIKLLREQIARQRVGTTDEGLNTRHFPAHEREELVQKLESAHEQYLQLERDLQTVLDEKEEQVTERDVYKTKYERLNQELNYILKGDENRVVDIDALVMENKYLQERLKQMEEEKSMAVAAVSKYKSMLEKKKTKSSLKFGQSRSGGMVITQKQVEKVLESKQSVPSVKAMTDLQALAGALLDSVNDKNLALSHQRKTNKILGSRVAELEKKLKTLEVAGLWNTSADDLGSLEKLREELGGERQRKLSADTDSDKLSESEGERDSELESVTPLDSTATSPLTSPLHKLKPLDHLELSDLDLLPTKEVPSESLSVSIGGDLIHLSPSPSVANISKTNSTDLTTNAAVIDIANDDTKHDDTNDDEAETPDNSFEFNTKVKVYSEDLNKTGTQNDEAIDKGIDGDDGSESEIEVETLEDISDLVVTGKDQTEADIFYDDNDEAGDSEKVGLLLESVAKKMCNITHQVSESGDGDDGVDDDNDNSDYQSGMGRFKNRAYNELEQDSPTMGRRLLSTEEALEQTKNVEC